MCKIFKFGIIGAGSIANKFCDAVKLIENAEIAAVASKSRDRAEAFAKKNSINHYYGNYEEMIKTAGLDGVYIATTHNFHYENIMLCLDMGLPVICEKCLVLTEKQARDVFEKAHDKQLFLMEAMWSRFIPAFQKAREWISSGCIGEIQTANYHFGFVGQQGTRIYDKNLAGGALYDIGVYAIEGLSYLINSELKGVKYSTLWAANKVDETNIVIMEYENCIASVHCSIAADMPAKAEIYGNKGRIVIPNAFDAQKIYMYLNDGGYEEFEHKYENGFVYQIKHFIENVEAGNLESDIIPPKDTIECAIIFDKILK